MNLVDLMIGPNPYVLIRFLIDDDGDLAADVQAGNGAQEDVRAALLAVLSGMDPLTAEEVEALTAPACPDCGCPA